MALVDWYILSMVCLAGAASPGPSWILLVNSVVKDGRKAGIAFGVAHGLGIFVYAALVAFGLMILISIAPWVSLVLEFIGLLFLLWLARSMIKNSFEIDSVNDVGSDWMSRQLLEHARNGFLIVFLNPKVAVFFIAIFILCSIRASASISCPRSSNTKSELNLSGCWPINISKVLPIIWYLPIALDSTP